MSKEKSIVQNVASRLTVQQAEVTLMELDKLQCQFADLMAEKHARVMAAQAAFEESEERLNHEIKERQVLLEAYLETHSADFAESPRSLDFDSGTIGFRLGQKQLKPLSKMTWDKVRNALEVAGAERFLRRAVEIDKLALVGAVQKDELSIDTVKSFGLRIVQEDRPFVETAYQKRVSAMAKKD